jgi:hemolysin activation/secretion protein
LTTEDLEALRLALTHLYVEHGYITSGAIIPDQTVTDGVITLDLIEGRLHDIEVAGQRWFRSGYFRYAASPGYVLQLVPFVDFGKAWNHTGARLIHRCS